MWSRIAIKLNHILEMTSPSLDCTDVSHSLTMAEIRLVLTHLLFNFNIEFAEETNRNWAHQKGWFTWAKTPLIVKLSIRND